MAYQPKESICCVECGATKTIARKLCRNCYYKHYNAGTLENFSILKPEDVFHQRYEKTASCWNWTGTKNGFGYGILLVNKKSIRAHRFSYEHFKGLIPDGMIVLHSCDNPACVNPSHLSLGTKLENNRDAVKKRRNAFGERNGRAKLTTEQVEFIKNSEMPQVRLANMFSVHQSQISKIRSGHRRSNG